jgi:hypothetical protein
VNALGYRIEHDPALRILAYGQPLSLRRDGSRVSATLPPEVDVAVVTSRTWVPLHLGETGEDARCLGIAVAEIHVDGQSIPLDDPRLCSGWHPPEANWRWSDGAGHIDVRGAQRLEFRLAETGHYWSCSNFPAP